MLFPGLPRHSVPRRTYIAPSAPASGRVASERLAAPVAGKGVAGRPGSPTPSTRDVAVPGPVLGLRVPSPIVGRPLGATFRVAPTRRPLGRPVVDTPTRGRPPVVRVSLPAGRPRAVGPAVGPVARRDRDVPVGKAVTAALGRAVAGGAAIPVVARRPPPFPTTLGVAGKGRLPSRVAPRPDVMVADTAETGPTPETPLVGPGVVLAGVLLPPDRPVTRGVFHTDMADVPQPCRPAQVLRPHGGLLPGMGGLGASVPKVGGGPPPTGPHAGGVDVVVGRTRHGRTFLRPQISGVVPPCGRQAKTRRPNEVGEELVRGSRVSSFMGYFLCW